jgi:DNA-binding MarR family transcriptional regulator
MLDIKVFPIEYSAGNILARAHLMVKLGLTRYFKANGFDLTPQHWAILNILWDTDGIAQNVLAKRVTKDNSNITRTLDRMEKKGLIRRRPNPHDRRSFRVFLTKKGKGSMEKLCTLVEEFSRIAYAGMSQKDYHEFMRLLHIILNNLEELKDGRW